MSEMLCKQVAEEMRRSGMNAVCWDSGGGVFGVGVARGGTPPDELRFFFGTADAQWEGEVLGEDGEVVEGLHIGIPSESNDPRRIAAGIFRAIADYAQAKS